MDRTLEEKLSYCQNNTNGYCTPMHRVDCDVCPCFKDCVALTRKVSLGINYKDGKSEIIKKWIGIRDKVKQWKTL